MRYSGKNVWLVTGLGFVAIVVAHILPHAFRMPEGAFPALLFGGLMFVGCLLFALSYWALDDIQRQHHMADWYWGSMTGLCLLAGLVLPFMLFDRTAAQALINSTHFGGSPRGYFFCGVIVTLGLFAGGAVLAWLLRRLRWMKQ